jgi:integrase
MTILPVLNPDVEVYVRHAPDCDHRSAPHYRKCTCPKWLYVKHGRRRVSAKTNVWSVAEQKAQEMRDSHDPVKRELAELKQTKKRNTVLIEDAIQKFLASKPKVEQSTLRGLRSSLFPMRDFLATRSVFYLHEISPEHLADWTHAEWGDIEPGTIRFKRIKVRSFFLYCIRNMKWLTSDQDPTSGLLESPGRKGIIQVVPFDRDQYAAILAATYKYGNIETGARLRALIQLMRWSGLAIRDAVTLRRSRLSADDLLQVSRAKTGTWVTVALPPAVAQELRDISRGTAHPDYFFWTGTSQAASVASVWARRLAKLWRLVKWPSDLLSGDRPVLPHSHMFRHTFAREFLRSGQGDIRDLSQLLGHRSIKTTEDYYLAFVVGRAQELNEKVRASFAAQGAPGYEPVAEPKRVSIN